MGVVPGSMAVSDDNFVAFVEPHLLAVRRALVARFGLDPGLDIAADVVAWAWEHQATLRESDNPAGYLFRVGQSRSRRYLRWRRHPLVPRGQERDNEADIDLRAAVAGLPAPQRVAVLLVHAFGYSYRDAAGLLDVSEAALRNHLHRGMARLRQMVETEDVDG